MKWVLVSPSAAAFSFIMVTNASSLPATACASASVASAPEGTTAPPKADNAYFDDAVFIGDSRTDGLRLYAPMEQTRP